MKKYKVYFEFFGKKMVTEIEAKSEEDAKEMIKKRLIFITSKESDDKTFDIIFKTMDQAFEKMEDAFDKMNSFFNKL